jgi:hypothetical protein
MPWPFFIRFDLLFLTIVGAGMPGAILGGVVTWRRHRRLGGVILGWSSGLIGALIGVLLLSLAESFLPHHEELRPFGPASVADYPPEAVLMALRISWALLGSAGLGWFFSSIFTVLVSLWFDCWEVKD